MLEENQATVIRKSSEELEVNGCARAAGGSWGWRTELGGRSLFQSSAGAVGC